MPIVHDQLGPGVLTLGAGPLDVSLQVTSCKLVTSENVARQEPIKVLGGDEIPASESVSFQQTLSGSFISDLSAAGVVQWSHDNAGQDEPFSFVPNSARGRKVEGTLSPIPLDFGGDEVEGAPMSADFTWRVTGDGTTPGERVIPEAVV
jgi:hypothetical protein